MMYMASFIALAILWPSLPIILKFSTDVKWPVLFWCSNIGNGAFRCSLLLSKVARQSLRSSAGVPKIEM